MTTMYDSTSPQNIPADAQAVARYINGLYFWPDDQIARFTGVPNKTITINTSADADVLDVEGGDATALESVAWVQRQRSRGIEPTVYCSREGAAGYGWPWVQSAFTAAGLPFPHFWIADYTDESHLVPGSSATQWTDHGDLYDISEADPTWLGGTPPKPTPPPPTEATMPGVSPAVITPDTFQHRGAIVYPGKPFHIWVDKSGIPQHEDILDKAAGPGSPNPSPPIAALTFVDQVPGIQIIGDQIVLTVQTGPGGSCWAFVQTIGTSGWGASQLL